MNVQDLINELEQYDDNLPVHFSYQYGDHWRTVVAPEVSSVTEGAVIHSSYHNMDKEVEEDHKDFAKAKRAIIISTD